MGALSLAITPSTRKLRSNERHVIERHHVLTTNRNLCKEMAHLGTYERMYWWRVSTVVRRG